jgi:DNA polymerase-3 subunit epsilon
MNYNNNNKNITNISKKQIRSNSHDSKASNFSPKYPSISSSKSSKPLSFFPNPNNRYIVLDADTTGLDQSCELIAINAVEIINLRLTGIQFHGYVNPKNLKHNGFLYYIEDYNIENKNNNNAFQVMSDFIRFVNDSIIISHNATFDMRFINNQLKILGMKIIPLNKVICTLIIARKVRFFGGFNENEYLNLENICKKYDVFIKSNDFHHGIVDATALARVVIKMWKDEKILKIVNSEMNKNYLMWNDSDEKLNFNKKNDFFFGEKNNIKKRNFFFFF